MMEREHGAASYNKGCRCASCKEAKAASARRSRTRHRIDPAPGLRKCATCGRWFLPRGIGAHEIACCGSWTRWQART